MIDQSRDVRTVSTETCELSGQQKMKSMPELAGGELYLPQRPHNILGVARRRIRIRDDRPSLAVTS